MATETKFSPARIDPRNAAQFDSILWVDERCENEVSKRKAKNFHIVPVFRSFKNSNSCEEYVQRRQRQSSEPSIVIIISGSFARSAIPVLENYSCVLAFIIYCGDKSYHADLNYSKLCGIFDAEIDIQRCLRNFLTFHIDASTAYLFTKPNSSIQESVFRETEKDKVMLLWYNTFNKFVSELDYFDAEIAKKDLIGILRPTCEENETWKDLLKCFEKESAKENAENAIKWYSEEFSLYQFMNKAFRNEEPREIYRYRYMIKLLCAQLKTEQRKFFNEVRTSQTEPMLKLYRGICVPPEFISMMKKSIGKIVSFNGFWSTSSDVKIAERFMNSRYVDGLRRILFLIKVDMRIDYRTVFANVDQYTKYRESEHLFSIGSMFHIDSIEFNENPDPFYLIQLSLSENDQSAVNHYIVENYSDDQQSVNQALLFGKLIFDMGDKHFALEYLCDIEDYLPKHNTKLRAIYFNNLGFCYNAVGDRQRALEYYQKAMELLKILGKDFALHSSYQNIARVHYDEKKYDEASYFAMEAVNQPVQRPVDHAVTFDLLGMIELEKKRYPEAQSLFDRSLRIRQQHYGVDRHTHPAIAMSYENFAIFYAKQSNYSEALRWFGEAARIYNDSYVPSHPSIERVDDQMNSIKKKIQSTRCSSRSRR